MSVRTTVCAAVALASISAPALAQTRESLPTYKFPATDGAKVYHQAYQKVANRLGSRAAGRDIVSEGIRFKWVSQDRTRKHWGYRRARWIEVRAATHHLRSILRPPPVAAPASSGWVIPASVVMCESGGKNLAPNSAGASGYYQIIPGTWAAYGGLAYAQAAYLAPKWAQDRVAARIWADGGNAQWDCKA